MATLNDFKFDFTYPVFNGQDYNATSIKLTEMYQGTICGLSGSKQSKGIIRRVIMSLYGLISCEVAWTSGPRSGTIEQVREYNLRDPKSYLLFLQKEVIRIQTLFPEVVNGES